MHTKHTSSTPANFFGAISLVFTVLLLGACASTTNNSAVLATTTTDSPEAKRMQEIDAQLSEISVSPGAMKLLTEETDEAKIREQLVCGKEKLPGSLRKIKVCRTQTEIDASSRNAKDEVETLVRRSLVRSID